MTKLIKDKSKTKRLVNPKTVAKALGAKATESSLDTRRGPISLLSLRQFLVSRLHSTGGRPRLKGTMKKRNKISFFEEDWNTLEKISRYYKEKAAEAKAEKERELKKQDIDGLDELYAMEDVKDIKEFLWSHDTNLISILYEAKTHIERIFKTNIVDIYLELDQDYEGDYEGLSLIIKTNIDPESSLDLLDKFDEEWWLNIDNSFLSIMVRPV